MSDQENQLIREATGQSPDFVEPEPEETNDSNETGDEQRERQNKFAKEVAIALHTETKQGKSSGRRKYRYGGK